MLTAACSLFFIGTDDSLDQSHIDYLYFQVDIKIFFSQAHKYFS